MGQGLIPENIVFKGEAEASSMKKSKSDHEEVQAETKETSSTFAKKVKSS